MMKIERKKLSQEFTELVLEWLKTQNVLSGEKIPPESDLADRFGVSRTTVREGVRSLAAIGVLETRRGIGTFVLNPEPGPLRYHEGAASPALNGIRDDLLEFRLIVEPETAALAALRHSPFDLTELHRCVEALLLAVAQGCTTKIPEDLGFHIALARASKNSALIDTSNMIARFYEKDPFAAEQDDVDEHRAIYRAIEAADPQQARDAMRAHLIKQKEKARTFDSERNR